MQYFHSISYKCNSSTCYELDCSVFETLRVRGEIIHTVKTSHGFHPASYTISTEALSSVKRPGYDLKHPLPSTVEVNERV